MGVTRIVSRPQPILWQSIDLWCATNGVCEDERPYLHILVRSMDAIFLQFKNDEITQGLQNALRG